MTTTHTMPRTLDAAEVARTLKVSRRTLRRLISRNQFPRGRQVSAGRCVWFEETVARWLRARPTYEPAPPGGQEVRDGEV